MADTAVELHGITKRFPGVVANAGVDLVVRRGTIHGLVGENGAGKSTLMKILYGMLRPDEGSMTVEGAPARFAGPGEAIRAGIGMVHQHFMLADNLTVLENVVLGAERLHGIGDRARRRVVELGERYGFAVDPRVLVADLGVGDRQRVEILKVLYRGARTLILDEPTAVLVPQEVDDLFANLRGLRAEGLTALFISHKLDEVLAIADEVTVLRRGRTVATVAPADVDARALARLMVGSDLPSPSVGDSTVTDRVVLEVRGVRLDAVGSRRRLLDDVGLTVRGGEVVGVAGVEGNGQAELVECVLGVRRPTGGSVWLDGQDVTAWSTRRRREAGVGYVPEDRHRHGLLLEAPLWENRVLGHQTRPPNAKGPWIDAAGARRDCHRIVEEYDVRTPGVDVLASALSGGNQQKLIVGRELSGSPMLLVASHPTRGVDVGAQARIWDALRAARARGLAVLLVSADLEELIGLSDRLVVMFGGRLVAEVDPATATPEALGTAMTGTTATPDDDRPDDDRPADEQAADEQAADEPFGDQPPGDSR